MSLSNDVRSTIPTLFGDAIEQLGKLVRSEVRLARAEISDKVAQAGTGAAYIAVAGMFMVPVLVVLLITLALWLNQMGISPIGSHLIAAAVGAAVSVIFGLIGVNRLKAGRLIPTATIQQVEQDMAMARKVTQ
jgi:hypothetical protein